MKCDQIGWFFSHNFVRVTDCVVLCRQLRVWWAIIAFYHDCMRHAGVTQMLVLRVSVWPQGEPQRTLLWSSAQAGRHHAAKMPTTSTGWARLLPTTEARTVSV